MKIKRVEDVKAWQAANQLDELVGKLTERVEFQKEFKLRDQMRDATDSTMANISEGFESGSDREFARFLKIAKRSAGEVQSQLHVARNRRLVPPTEFGSIYDKCEEVKFLCGGFIRYLTRPRPQ